MAISATGITLAAATATKVASGANGSATVPVRVVIWNPTAAVLYIGGSAITDAGATQGLPVAASAFSPPFDLVAGDDLYAYSVAGGVINVLLTRQ
jgi:hypothetical protein